MLHEAHENPVNILARSRTTYCLSQTPGFWVMASQRSGQPTPVAASQFGNFGSAAYLCNSIYLSTLSHREVDYPSRLGWSSARRRELNDLTNESM